MTYTPTTNDRVVVPCGHCVLLFDHASPKARRCAHRRKPFWLRYVLQGCALSRPLLNPDDRALLRQVNVGPGNFGRLAGMSSAFVLDFGAVRVVEFNRVGACYVYPRAVADEVIADLWIAGEFRAGGSKRKKTSYLMRIFTAWSTNLAGRTSSSGFWRCTAFAHDKCDRLANCRAGQAVWTLWVTP